MSDSSAFGFGKFIPGFDFLQNLGKAGPGTGELPPFAHWVAPTVSVEEIEKRIEALKTVQFWLEQNSRALTATVQALEVQRMTLTALEGMNVNLGDLGKAFPFAAPGNLSGWPGSAATPAAAAAPTAPPEPPAEPPQAQAAASDADASAAAQADHLAPAMQWWGALTQQFQQIAQQTLQDPAQQQALLNATQMGSDFAQTAVKTASDMVRQAAAQAPAAPAEPAAATAASRKAKPAASAKTAPTQPAAKSAAKPAAPRRAPAQPAAAAKKAKAPKRL